MTAAGLVVKSADGTARRPLTNARDGRLPTPPRQSPAPQIQPKLRRRRATSRFRFPDPLQQAGSRSGKHIKLRDQRNIKQRDAAHDLKPHDIDEPLIHCKSELESMDLIDHLIEIFTRGYALADATSRIAYIDAALDTFRSLGLFSVWNSRRRPYRLFPMDVGWPEAIELPDSGAP